MATKKERNFTVSGRSYNALGIYAIVPTETGCVVRWAHGVEEEFKGITVSEITFKIDEAKARTDSD